MRIIKYDGVTMKVWINSQIALLVFMVLNEDSQILCAGYISSCNYLKGVLMAMQVRNAVFAKAGNSRSQVMKGMLTKRSSTAEVNALKDAKLVHL